MAFAKEAQAYTELVYRCGILSDIKKYIKVDMLDSKKKLTKKFDIVIPTERSEWRNLLHGMYTDVSTPVGRST